MAEPSSSIISHITSGVSMESGGGGGVEEEEGERERVSPQRAE